MNTPIKYLSLFTGIGAFEKAFERLGIKYELVGYSEIDKYASKAYELIHGVDHSKALGDICQIDTSKLPSDIDMITYGFPCQDISVAGLQRGLTDEEGGYTRSGLFYEALRLIQDLKPEYAIAENVKALTSDKFSTEFKTIFQCLDDAGYNNYWQVLNAKDFGIPQNRERVFIVSVRKDIDTGVQFPTPFKLEKRLKDVLEIDVDESFYLSDAALSKLSFYREIVRPIDEINIIGKISDHQWGEVYNNNNVVSCLQARDYKTPKLIYDSNRVIQVAGMDRENWKNSQRNRVYSPAGISPTIHTMAGGQLEPCVLDDFIAHDGKERIYQDVCCTIPANHDVLKVIEAFRGRNPNNPNDRTKGCPTEQRLELNTTGCSNTLTTVSKDNFVVEGLPIRIRKLTPKECFRLMGFDDRDCDILTENGISNTQIYKMAGNSIVVNVLEEIFKSLFNPSPYGQQRLFL